MACNDIVYQADGPVGCILHNRPTKRNAQTIELLDEVDEALDRTTMDNTVKVIVIGAVVAHLSAGHDVVAATKARRNLSVEAAIRKARRIEM